VVNHKEGAKWNNAQTITHVRNVFGQPLLYRHVSLKSIAVDITNWDQIKAKFEIDFEAASSVEYKITEIKLADHKDVNEYFGWCIKTMIELKSKIDKTIFLLPTVELTAAQASMYEDSCRMITEMTTENVTAILIRTENREHSITLQYFLVCEILCN
jgi:hypothetical protein